MGRFVYFGKSVKVWVYWPSRRDIGKVLKGMKENIWMVLFLKGSGSVFVGDGVVVAENRTGHCDLPERLWLLAALRWAKRFGY